MSSKSFQAITSYFVRTGSQTDIYGHSANKIKIVIANFYSESTRIIGKNALFYCY